MLCRSRMLTSPHRWLLAIAPIAAIAAIAVGSGACSSSDDGRKANSTLEEEDATTEGKDGSTTEPGDSTALDTLCTAAQPASGTKCSPTQPCPEPFSCFYAPGCDSPQGTCQLFDICDWPDTYMDVSRCGCDGASVDDKTPFRNVGECDAPAN